MSLQSYQVPFYGNLTRDPELKVLENSSYVVNFGVANTPRYKDKDGTWKDGTTLYQECTAFGKLAQHISESLQKGNRVVGIGNMRARTWMSNGEERRITEIVVEEIGPSLLFGTVSVHRNASQNSYSENTAPQTQESPSNNPFE